MSTTIVKKRELLPKLNKIIVELSKLSGDVAKLELYDNEQASKRVRKSIIDVRNIHLDDFLKEISNLRIDINLSKGREVKRGKKEVIKLEPDSE